MPIDPDLVGVWMVPGDARTYEIDPAGGYHVAEPESPVAFRCDGAVMLWEGEAHDRLSGKGDTPEGRWRGRDTGAEWAFDANGRYAVTLDGVTDTGIWALRHGGDSLWTCEAVGRIATNGAMITYHLNHGPSLSYSYTAGAGLWSLHDPMTWKTLVRFRNATSLTDA
jgi:hypothetical protein